MKILKIALLSVVALAALLAIVGVFLPSKYGTERSILIKAPVEDVFMLVNDLEKMQLWSPWRANDDTMQVTYGDVKKGLGAVMSWTSVKSGNGSMVISESIPFESVVTDLDFMDMGTARARFTFQPTQEGVKATWGFEGDAGWNLMGRYMGLMMDHFVGKDYDQGLTALKKVAEGA
jgi:hypothetical protein